MNPIKTTPSSPVSNPQLILHRVRETPSNPPLILHKSDTLPQSSHFLVKQTDWCYILGYSKPLMRNSMKHLLILISILLIMSGCTPYVISFNPHVISSNPRQVTIGNAVSTVKSQKLADKTCQKHGRWAILHFNETLNCLTPSKYSIKSVGI